MGSEAPWVRAMSPDALTVNLPRGLHLRRTQPLAADSNSVVRSGVDKSGAGGI